MPFSEHDESFNEHMEEAVDRFMDSIPATESEDSREGFTKGDRVRHPKPPADDFPDDGIVNGWCTFEYGPGWYCSVTWGGQYIGRYQANELEHDDRP